MEQAASTALEHRMVMPKNWHAVATMRRHALTTAGFQMEKMSACSNTFRCIYTKNARVQGRTRSSAFSTRVQSLSSVLSFVLV